MAEESILNSIKKSLGLQADYDVFDPEIIMHINTVFSTLTQLGIGPVEGFAIADDAATWNTFLGPDPRFAPVKTYIYIKVKLVFDPPPTSFQIASLEKVAQEFEWRLSVLREDLIPIPVEVVEASDSG